MNEASDQRATVHEALRLVLGALNPHQDPQEHFKTFEPSETDWDAISVVAIALGLGPVFRKVIRTNEIAIPKSAALKLEAIYGAQKKRNENLKELIDAINDHMKAEQANGIFLKGAHLAFSVYDDPAERPMSDIDILVSPADFPFLDQILVKLGFEPEQSESAKHPTVYKRLHDNVKIANPYLASGPIKTVEPHTSLCESRFGLTVDITEGVFQRSQSLTVGDLRYQVLGDEDLLLHLLIHFSAGLIISSPSMVQLVDLLKVLENKVIDWVSVLDRAEDADALGFVYGGLRLSTKLIGAPVPSFVLDKLSQKIDRTLRTRIENMDLRYLLDRTQKPPRTNLRNRLRLGYDKRRETFRWASTFLSKMNVARHAVRLQGSRRNNF